MIAKTAVAFPLMTHPAPDTAERKRLAMQAVPFWLPTNSAQAGIGEGATGGIAHKPADAGKDDR